MALPLQKLQTITRLADIMYDFLPGKAHPYANQSLSFGAVARSVGLEQFWTSGSKKPSIAALLEHTLDQRPNKFCTLITEIVRASMRYRASKTPITREEIELLNKEIFNLGFKIPELVAPSFLANFPSKSPSPHTAPTSTPSGPQDLGYLRPDFHALHTLAPEPRGFAFERFLKVSL